MHGPRLTLDDPTTFDDLDAASFTYPPVRVDMASTGSRYTTIVYAVLDGQRILLYCSTHSTPRIPDGVEQVVEEFNADPRAGWIRVLSECFDAELDLIAQSRAELDAEESTARTRRARFFDSAAQR